MKKHIITSIITATLLGSMATSVLASGNISEKGVTQSNLEQKTPFGTKSPHAPTEIKSPLDELITEKNLLINRLFSTEFSAIPFNEQLSMLHQSFVNHKEIYDRYKKDLLGSQTNTDFNALSLSLTLEHREMEKELELFNQSIIHSKAGSQNDFSDSKEEVEKTLIALKEARNSGREVYDLFMAVQQASQVNQITLLQQVVTASIKENKMEQAIESLAKIVKLSGGDQDYVNMLTELIEGNESFLLLNHELKKMEDPWLKSEEKWYVSLDELKKWMEVSIQTSKEGEAKVVITHKEHEVAYQGDNFFYDGVFIGTPTVWKADESGKAFLDAEFIFELFGYRFSPSTDDQLVRIEDPIYLKSELDSMPVKEVVNAIYSPQIK